MTPAAGTQTSGVRRRRLAARALAVWVAAGLPLALGADPPAADAADSAPVLAIAGYAEDAACASCHTEIAISYQAVGMSRSFARPTAERAIEIFDEPFLHAPSGRVYSMARRGDAYVFSRHQLDAAGQPIFAVELPVAWILGSGHTSRTYFYASPSGELFQLPLAWYSQEQRWGMAPGYDDADHPGLSRRVRRECMFCHNAYPAIAAGADRYGTHPLFSDALPQGTGCQRCHGPGADHIELAATGAVETAVRDAIVNPGKLAPELARDVCYQCHLQPAVALFGARRFGRGDYSYRPGEPLAEYRVLVDVDQASRQRDERFEINHHPYRLEQSACFQQSAGAMSCLTCHDPHRKVAATERARHYRAACESCHAADTCSRPEHAVASDEPAAEPDCVACHMARRRTQDVVHVTMTDHRIGRRPWVADPLAPLTEYEPILTGLELVDDRRAPAGDLGEIYKAATVARLSNGASLEAVERLDQLLARHPVPQAEPYLDLALGQLTHGRWAAALDTLAAAQARAPDLAILLLWQAIAENGLGHTARAIELAGRALAAEPAMPEAHLNLGLFQRDALRPGAAAAAFTRAVELRPTFVAGWHNLGLARESLGDLEAARRAQERALDLDPRATEAYLALIRVLVATGDDAAARRVLALARHHARQPAALPATP